MEKKATGQAHKQTKNQKNGFNLDGMNDSQGKESIYAEKEKPSQNCLFVLFKEAFADLLILHFADQDPRGQ